MEVSELMQEQNTLDDSRSEPGAQEITKLDTRSSGYMIDWSQNRLVRRPSNHMAFGCTSSYLLQ